MAEATLGIPRLDLPTPARLAALINSLLDVTRGGGRPIEVAVERADSDARLTVRDRGIGTAPEQQSRIFEHFERAVSSRHDGGFGIGLRVARHLVEAHGGDISVISRPGQGSCFRVRLPLGER